MAPRRNRPGLFLFRSRTGRLWKLTGHGKLRASAHPHSDLPTPVGNPGPARRRDSHSYDTAATARRQIGGKEEERGR